MEFAAVLAAFGFLMLCFSVGEAIERVSKAMVETIKDTAGQKDGAGDGDRN
jgi:hypothetical protein